jgi:hypothetical protein
MLILIVLAKNLREPVHRMIIGYIDYDTDIMYKYFDDVRESQTARFILFNLLFFLDPIEMMNGLRTRKQRCAL